VTWNITRIRTRSKADREDRAVVSLIGNTPLIELKSLSKVTGRTILAKLEFCNPGGSTKDRVCLQIINDAERRGDLRPGDTLYEGSSGSTGISLAFVGRAKGYKVHVCMPDDQAREKSALIRSYGAVVEEVPPASIVDANQYVNLAKQRAVADPHGYFANQFENLSNARAHYETTAAEIWQQTGGRVDAFVAGSGTGGTLAGVSRYLKERRASIVIALVDPPGSSLLNKVVHGVLYDETEAEGTRRRTQVDTVTEGVGLNRLTRNFARAHIDTALRADDRESVCMSRHLVRHEALFVGSSSALNCVGAVKLARMLPPRSVVVTLLCDSGVRHGSVCATCDSDACSLTQVIARRSKFWNDQVGGRVVVNVACRT
jgi:cysteine synthase A